jgi:hypothetical protein
LNRTELFNGLGRNPASLVEMSVAILLTWTGKRI